MMTELYNNVTRGLPYVTSSYMPRSKNEIIREAFGNLTAVERNIWLDRYGSDFKMFGYSIPSYLTR